MARRVGLEMRRTRFCVPAVALPVKDIRNRARESGAVVRGDVAVRDQQTTVYVGNLPWDTTEDDLAALFGEVGPVLDVRVIQDRVTGRAAGYGFVELSSPEYARRACAVLNGRQLNGRALLVSPARPKPPRT